MQTKSTTTSLQPTRAGFVRSLPVSMPVEEVIERGRDAGITLQPSDVHSARYYMRQASAAQLAHKTKFSQQLVLGGTSAPRSVSQDDDSAAQSAGSLANLLDRNHAAESERTPGEAVATRSDRSTKSRTQKHFKALNGSASLEEQLRTLVLRLGTDRTREVIEELNALAIRVADR